MKGLIVMAAIRESALGERLVEVIDESGGHGLVIDLDAAHRGLPLSVTNDAVVWQGVDLCDAAAVVVERPVFPWPQPQQLPEGDAPGKAVAREREARSLTVSALRTAALHTRVIDEPTRSARFAASRALAFVDLEAAGVPTAPWQVVEDRRSIVSSATIVRDLVARERHHTSDECGGDGPAFVVRAASEITRQSLVLGASVLDLASGEAAAPDVAQLGRRVRDALGLSIFELTLTEDRLVADVEPAPDLAAHDARLGGRVAVHLAELLLSTHQGGDLS